MLEKKMLYALNGGKHIPGANLMPPTHSNGYKWYNQSRVLRELEGQIRGGQVDACPWLREEHSLQVG